MHRRTLLKATLAGTASLVLGPIPARSAPGRALDLRLAALERTYGGRLGVAMLDTGSGQRLVHRGDQRFLLCSTFKWLAVAAILRRVENGDERLDRRIVFERAAVLGYAPATRHRVGAPGMSVAELCEAAIVLSDNTAANLLLSAMGGPRAVTAFARSVGDAITRLDRTEPELNLATPGGLRDTTTPNAMLATMRRVLLGDVLSPISREQLLGWMRGCRTGDARLRAGLPAGWSAGDKTGTGPDGEANDVAILWPPRRAPLLVAAYYHRASGDAASRDTLLAEVGQVAVALQAASTVSVTTG